MSELRPVCDQYGPRIGQVESLAPMFGPVCSPFMVIVAHRAGVRRPAACRCTQATLPGKAHDLPVCAIARPLPCPDNQRRPHSWLCNPVSMPPFGGWDDEPAATFDGAGAIVA